MVVLDDLRVRLKHGYGFLQMVNSNINALLSSSYFTLNYFKHSRKMVGIFLTFFWCCINCDMTLKIINRLKINNNNIKFNDNFKRHIIIERIPEKHLIETMISLF